MNAEPVVVTQCPPGKRSPFVVRRERGVGITTRTALGPKEPRVIVCGGEPDEAEDSQEKVYRRAPTALEIFAWRHKPRPLGEHLIDAGNRYAEIVVEYKMAVGFDVTCGSDSVGAFASLTPEQVAAKADLAKQRKADCDAILRRIIPGLPAKLEALAYLGIEPSPYDENKIVHGLIMLAKHFCFEPRSRMRD